VGFKFIKFKNRQLTDYSINYGVPPPPQEKKKKKRKQKKEGEGHSKKKRAETQN